MINVKEFYYPESLDEALELFSKNKGQELINVPVAGSTDIVFSRNPLFKGLVDINRIGLDYIKKEENVIKIGATTTIRKIAKSELLKDMGGGVLSKAASLIGSRLIRNTCTIGGNLMALRIWSDLPVALLVLDGNAEIRSKEERKVISIEELLKKRPSKIINSTELLTEIIIPATPENVGGAFIKFTRTKFDYTLMDIGAYIELEKGRIKKCRIAVSAVTPFPVRLKEVEKIMEGNIPDGKLIKEASEMAKDQIKPIKTFKVGEDYRKYLTGVLFTRIFEEITEGVIL